jgi:2-oxoglutarate dehydrogenase E2 component (dihydrolipoamide succinyltransferase)
VKLPRLSQATKDAVIVRWFGTEGDQVASGEPLLEVETDKASVEIESPGGEYLHYFKRIHINVAIDTERGLLVPVVRDADEKDLMSVNAEIESLACRGREGVLSVEEMQGGTFTVTNSGVLGSLLFTPVINYPQGATLGMGKVEARTVVREDKIVARPMMYLCLSYDHRFIEGATAVRFLQAVKANLEDVVTRMKE